MKNKLLDELSEDTKKYCILWSVFDAETNKDVGETEGCGILRNGVLIDLTGRIELK